MALDETLSQPAVAFGEVEAAHLASEPASRGKHLVDLQPPQDGAPLPHAVAPIRGAALDGRERRLGLAHELADIPPHVRRRAPREPSHNTPDSGMSRVRRWQEA